MGTACLVHHDTADNLEAVTEPGIHGLAASLATQVHGLTSTSRLGICYNTSDKFYQ